MARYLYRNWLRSTVNEFVEKTNFCEEQAVSLGQGAYYFASGVWPLVSMRSFESVTGPKTDKWLVKTVGVLVGVIGATLMVAGSRKAVGPEVRLLAAGSAAGLAAVDVVYVAQGRISPVYLFDAAAEFGLLWLWGSIARRSKRRSPSLADSGKRRRPRMKGSPHRVDR